MMLFTLNLTSYISMSLNQLEGRLDALSLMKVGDPLLDDYGELRPCLLHVSVVSIVGCSQLLVVGAVVDQSHGQLVVVL